MEVWLSSPGIEQRGAHEPQPFPMAGLQRPQLRGCPGRQLRNVCGLRDGEMRPTYAATIQLNGD